MALKFMADATEKVVKNKEPNHTGINPSSSTD